MVTRIWRVQARTNMCRTSVGHVLARAHAPAHGGCKQGQTCATHAWGMCCHAHTLPETYLWRKMYRQDTQTCLRLGVPTLACTALTCRTTCGGLRRCLGDVTWEGQRYVATHVFISHMVVIVHVGLSSVNPLTQSPPSPQFRHLQRHQNKTQHPKLYLSTKGVQQPAS